MAGVLVLIGGLPGMGKTTLARQLAAAGSCLAAGTDVVADAVFPVAASRAPWTELARRHGVDAVWVRLVCSDPAEHRRRVEHRSADLPGHRVPTWAEVTGREADDWAEPHAVVDTAGPDPLDEICTLVGIRR